jgi:hypothetical protein
MTPEDCQPVSVSRRIAAPAERLFAVLASPARHPSIDGSGMVRRALTPSPISRAGLAGQPRRRGQASGPLPANGGSRPARTIAGDGPVVMPER